MALDADTWENALKPALSDGIKDIFQEMHSGDDSKDDDWFAEQLADLFSSVIASTGTDQIKTAGIPAGSVVVSVDGQATGTPNPDEITVT